MMGRVNVKMYVLTGAYPADGYTVKSVILIQCFTLNNRTTE